MRISKKNRDFLVGQHSIYCDFNQKERSDCKMMAERGHPKSNDYKKLMKFFEELKYASNSAERFFSFCSVTDHSMYSRPEISLSWYPEGIDGFVHVFPAHERWEEYIDASAKAGWPNGVEPSIAFGSWTIRTTDSKLVNALVSYADSAIGLSSARAVWGSYRGESTCTVNIHDFVQGMTMDTFNGIQAIIREHHKGYVLPKRTQEDRVSDESELPLEKKTFAFANVETIKVTDRKVLMPQIPLGASRNIIDPLASGLITLVEKGFPFSEAKDWLKSFNPTAFRKLQSRFGNA